MRFADINIGEWRSPRSVLGQDDWLERQLSVRCPHCGKVAVRIVRYRRLDMHALNKDEYYKLRFIKLAEAIGALVGDVLRHLEGHGLEV